MMLKTIAFQVHPKYKLRENGTTSGLSLRSGSKLVSELRPYKDRAQTQIRAQGFKIASKFQNYGKM